MTRLADMNPRALSVGYAAGSEMDPGADVQPWEEEAAEALSDAEWNARFDDEPEWVG